MLNFFDHVSRIYYESNDFQDIDAINIKPSSLLEPLIPLISLIQRLTASQLPESTASITQTPQRVAKKISFNKND